MNNQQRPIDNSSISQWVGLKSKVDKQGNAHHYFGVPGSKAHGHVVQDPNGKYPYVRDPNGSRYI